VQVDGTGDEDQVFKRLLDAIDVPGAAS